MDRQTPTRTCPLCGEAGAEWLHETGGRDYFCCADCGLVFMAAEHRPRRGAEYAHYLTHENDPADARYRRFLNRLAEPLAAKLKPGASGLDYGAGPGPTLSVMLRERGFAMTDYDPFFASDPSALARRYDFVACTETAEHFHRPAEAFVELDRLLRPGGWLGVMTQLLESPDAFADWWYHRDPTHVSFYQERTMRWVAERHGWVMEVAGSTVVLFGKPG